MVDSTVVQFVCFRTPLPKAVFTPAWVPFATTFLAQGLQRIVLAERIGNWQSASPAYNFVSRNLWPKEAFIKSLQAGRIGDGGGGPIRAEQGGTFEIAQVVPGPEQREREKVIALLSASNRDLRGLSTTIKDTFATHTDVDVSIYQESAIDEHQRFDFVVEMYSPRDQGAALAVSLEETIAGAFDVAQSSIGVYREVMTLPPLSMT